MITCQQHHFADNLSRLDILFGEWQAHSVAIMHGSRDDAETGAGFDVDMSARKMDTVIGQPSMYQYMSFMEFHVLDLFARKMVGWAIAPSMPAELACDALDMAIQQRQPGPRAAARP
jgi:transposase InsO family protein